jgi:hypothetical protein
LIDLGIAVHLIGDPHVSAVLNEGAGFFRVGDGQLGVRSTFGYHRQVTDATKLQPLHVLQGAVGGLHGDDLLEPAVGHQIRVQVNDHLVHGIDGQVG